MPGALRPSELEGQHQACPREATEPQTHCTNKEAAEHPGRGLSQVCPTPRLARTDPPQLSTPTTTAKTLGLPGLQAVIIHHVSGLTRLRPALTQLREHVTTSGHGDSSDEELRLTEGHVPGDDHTRAKTVSPGHALTSQQLPGQACAGCAVSWALSGDTVRSGRNSLVRMKQAFTSPVLPKAQSCRGLRHQASHPCALGPLSHGLHSPTHPPCKHSAHTRGQCKQWGQRLLAS